MQSPVTFDVYRSSTKFEDETPDDGITNEDMMDFVSTLTKVREKQKFGAENEWHMSIRDLDRQDDVGNPYYYYILETVPSFGNELYEVNEAEGTILIKNRIAPKIVNLTVTKAALKDDPRQESLDIPFDFTLKLQADKDHPIQSWKVYTDTEAPENDLVTNESGEVKFKLKPTNPDDAQSTDGASIILNLPAGVTASVTETYNAEYTVATTASVDGTVSDDGRTFSYKTDSGTKSVTLTYTNTLHVVCKVVPDGSSKPVVFESLKSALTYIRKNSDDFTSPWTIYMLEDYTIPVTDIVSVGDGESLILTTASKTDPLFPFTPHKDPDRAVITRGGAGDSMLKNAGTLTLENICLDGGNIRASGDGGLVYSTGTLNLNGSTTLRNSVTDGRGGAIYVTGMEKTVEEQPAYVKGEINIENGVTITGNSAPSASALYLNGTLNMTGGNITNNTGAIDGAVVIMDATDVIHLSGSPVIFGNTSDKNKAANLYIGVDSDKAVTVIAPGLGSEAHIGVSAMDSHMLIGEQFATADFDQTANLNRFVNDEYGYRGKLKDGTATNIVWDGLTIEIQKIVDSVGANPADRFTITLSSPYIVMSSYVIEGTLDYTITPKIMNKPGRIVLNNVKDGDSIKISPLPVGDYTISESASNYAPVYKIAETGETPKEIEGGSFYAENNSSITVTNTRRLAAVKLKKTLDDRLKAAEETQRFDFTVTLTEEDGTKVSGFTLAEGITTNENGVASFTMLPTNAAPVIREFKAPVGATMTITETIDPNYEITASAKTMPKTGEGTAITDADEDNDNIFTFTVTDDGADVTFANVRKMAEIELSKTLTGKVSKTESFTFTLTLTNGNTPVANYEVYRDETDPSNSITTNEEGVAEITLSFGKNETTPKSIPLTIPEGTKLVVAETEVKKDVGGTQKAIYDTTYSINGGTGTSGLKATINQVSDSDHSIVFNNTRKTNTITVKNTVSGYSGNVVPFTFTATVTDGGENQDDYDLYGFTDGEMTFELTTGQSRALTVPYGATLTVEESMIIHHDDGRDEKIDVIGYETKIKHGNTDLGLTTEDTFQVTGDVTVAFTNTQLINLVIVNNTPLAFVDVQVKIRDATVMYRVNDLKNGQEPVDSFDPGEHQATISVDAGKTAILEVNHTAPKGKKIEEYEDPYTVTISTPVDGYYYTINNEPSFHEFANPAIAHIYNKSDNVPFGGSLRYSVSDSTITISVQPLVSFDSNGGAWTTAMDGYHDRNGDRKVYQTAVDSGKTVARPTPDPIYPTAEGIGLLGWTADEAFAKDGHTAGEDISAKAYNFDTPVTAPLTLYAVWAKPARSTKTVTLKNSTGDRMNLSLTLVNSSRVGKITLADTDTVTVITDKSGKASIDLDNGNFINLSIPDSTKLVIEGIASGILSISEEFADSDSEEGSYTIASVQRDGTVTFVPGVCKITDVEGAVLYDANGKPAVYGTLSAAFTAYNGTLYTDASHTTRAAQAAVKMLVDEYAVTGKLDFPNKNMTLTTADKDDGDFPFFGIQDRATLYRPADFTGNRMLSLETNERNVTLENLVLDGRNRNSGLVYLGQTKSTLTIGSGVTMCNVVYTEGDAYGGAIRAYNGTLNITAGRFTNLNAKYGGAISVEKTAILNLSGTGGSARFEECSAEINGGAVYYTSSSNLTIDGGSDNGFEVDENGNTRFDGEGKKIEVSNPGIVFLSCTAKGTEKTCGGGAIFIYSGGTVSIQGCSFAECSARVNQNDDRTSGGGAIAARNVNSITVSNCTFRACDTMTTGGAVFAKIKDGTSMTVNNCIFRNDSCKGQGGGIGVYQNNENSQTTALLTVNGCSFENCSSGTQNGSGGAIQSYLPCMSLNNSEFSDCWAGKEGGGINNYFGNNYTQQWAKSYINMSGCTFTRCRAEDRFQVDIVIHYGGALNTKANTVNVDDCEFVECVSTLRDGGALHLGGCGAGSSATISNSTFTSCTAKKHGGAVFSSAEKLEVSGSTFNGCQSTADNGGAVYHGMNCRSEDYVKKETKITNCKFKQGCGAAINGSAVWTAAQSAVITGCTIEGCTTGNSGAIYLSDKDVRINTSSNKETGTTAISVPMPSGALTRATLTGGSITGCQAVSGSAVYVGNSATFSSRIVDGDTVTDSPLTVSGNTVSALNSGAIQTVDTGMLYFEGNVKVENNTCSADAANHHHDVLMQINDNTIINTTENGLGSGANIGVYVSDPNSAYANHGQYSQPFGTYHNSPAGSNFLDAFFNDRDSELYGYQGDTFIHWGFYVCKITDKEGNTLKRTNGRDAVYQQLSQAFDEFKDVKDDNGETGKAVYIKMLVEDYAIRQDAAISNFPVTTPTTPAANITLTTASRSDDNHPYRGTEGTVSTIYRTNSENPNPLFDLGDSGATFQLRDITLDGRRNDKTATEGAYKLITANTGEIVVNSGTTLQYAKGDTGAAITGVKVTIKGSYDAEKKAPTVKITNCTATLSGGAISTQDLTITNTSEEPGEYGTAFTNCTSGTETESGKGGAIHAAGTAVTMAGASFTGCSSTGEGGVLFHNYSNDTGTESAATAITNCAFNDSEATGGAGGAVSSNAATLTVNGSSFDTIKAAGNGGAISHTGTEGTTITNTTFTDCLTDTTDTTVGFGGSVYTEAKTVTLNGGEFNTSTSANHGGALYCQSNVEDSAATVSGTSFVNCSSNFRDGAGGAIYSRTKVLTLQDDSATETATTINACKAMAYSGAVYMETSGSTLNVKDSTVISGCYANEGGAIYLKAGVTMNLTDSPTFSRNGYTNKEDGTIENAANGACIYLEYSSLEESSRINLSGSPKFSRNILTNKINKEGCDEKGYLVNGGVKDYPRQDIFMAGYWSATPYAKNAYSIYIVGELKGEIWIWPQCYPHKKPNTQFAKIDLEDGVSLSDTALATTLGMLRNALADGNDTETDDNHTECTNGEHLAGVQVGKDYVNVYWDRMYAVSFMKKDNKAVPVPGAEFTLYKDIDCREADVVAKAVSLEGAGLFDPDRGKVEFTSIRIGAYYMKESKVPLSFKENNIKYLVLVGTPYLSKNSDSASLWEAGGPLDVSDAETLVPRYTIDTGRYYGIFPLDENNKAVLRANIGSANVGIENIRNDFQASFMKVDSDKKALPGAAFTIYTAILGSDGQPQTYDDGYPKLVRWSRDGLTYPDPVVSADDTDKFKDKYNNTLPAGVVYFRELPLGTYYLLETYYPERNGEGKRTYYLESDRVFKLDLEENPNEQGKAVVTLSEWKPKEGDPTNYDKLEKDGKYYVVGNQEIVCKLTDADNNLLYTQGRHEIQDGETSSYRLFPAIYPTLEEGFAAAQTGSFVDKDGNPISEENPIDLMLQVLKDYTLKKEIVYSNNSRNLTLTTAPITLNSQAPKHSKDRYIFSTTRTSDTSRALITRGYSATGSSGALITIKDGATMTVQSITLNGQKSQFNGRAIHIQDGQLKILADQRYQERTVFEEFAVNADGSIDAKGGAILLDDNTSLTIDGGYYRAAVFSKNQVVNEITDVAHTGADGGAIAVGAYCTFSITNAQFDNNHAISSTAKKGNGGAISINRTKDAAEMMNLPIYNVVFSGNSASYQGGAIRAAENCSLVVNNCTFANNKANTFTGQTDAPGEGGAIAVLSRKDSPSTLTISEGIFTGNSAAGSKGGAVKIGGYGELTLTGNVDMSGNTAANGGAVTVAPGARVTMESGTIRSNTASANGGAFYVEAKQEEDGTVTSGSLTISGGSVTENKASLGSAVFVANNAKATITNAGITDNTASASNGGAINVGGPNARLYFGDTPTVFDNFNTQDKNQQMNLVLSENYNDVINTTTGGLVDGVIGVFVIESDSTVFENHGLPGMPFGTFGDTATRFNPQVFRSDHALALYGVKNNEDTSDTLIYWVDVICKLTDAANDKILYQDINLTINGKKEVRKAQAVYARITEPDDPESDPNGFNASHQGFDAAQGKLYVRDESSYRFSDYPNNANTTVKLKMLKDYDLDKSILYKGSRMVTFTTAETSDTRKDWGDYFCFNTDRTGADGKALIRRGFANDSMIKVTGTRLTLTDITLDGAKDTYKSSANGGIVNVASGSALTVESGAALQDSETTGNGGAVYVETNGTATITGGTINGNTAANGAGVYLDWRNADNHAILNLSGNPDFGGTDRKGGNDTDKDDLKGTDGNFVRKDSNDSSFKTEDKEPTNGGKAYPKDGNLYLVRQDIFIPGTAQPHTAIRVTGEITSGDGTIWVWANGKTDTVNHYEMLKQFAVYTGNGTLQDASMRAFRNAQPDSLTNCGGDYLTGQKGEAINNWECIYWTGGFNVVLRKIDSFGKDMNDATFTLYRSDNNGLPTNDAFQRSVNGTMQNVTATSRNYTEGESLEIRVRIDADNAESRTVYGNSLVLFEKIPVGTYYVRETGVRINGVDKTADYRTAEEQYKLVIDASGWYTLYTPIHNVDGTISWTQANLSTAPTTLFVSDANGKYTKPTAAVGASANTLEVYTLLNAPKIERKVILRKVVENSYEALQGAQFRIFSADMSEIISRPDYNDTLGAYQTLASGVYFVGKLSAGTYYLVETSAPNAANAGKVFKLTVNTDGSTTAPAELGKIDVSTADKIPDNLKHQVTAW